MREPSPETNWVYLGTTVLIGLIAFVLGVLIGAYYGW